MRLLLFGIVENRLNPLSLGLFRGSSTGFLAVPFPLVEGAFGAHRPEIEPVTQRVSLEVLVASRLVLGRVPRRRSARC